MKYIVATEDKHYWRWQMLVQINNFKNLKIDKDLIYVVGFKSKPSAEILKMQNETGVRMVFIQDERESIIYSPSIRPHILRKFFYKYPEYSECYMYLDPDVLILRKLKLGTILKNNITYVSDTRSYLCADYIKSKSPDLLHEMANIVGIDEKLIVNNDANAGGAQYIFKNVDFKFWQKVEVDSIKLYQHMEKTKSIYMPKYPIQSWTSDMWAVLWNLWLLNKKTKIIDILNFAWASDGYSNIDNVNIYHNAGITSQNDCFNKGHYLNKSPFFVDYSFVNKNMASYRYVEEILETEKKYGELI